MAPRSARELALAVLRQWRANESFADAILFRLLGSSDLAPPDRAFTTELVYGILRNLILLDFWIDTLRAKRLDPDARDLLRLGIYQLFLLRTPAHAAVYETVELADSRKRSLINAVLRSALRRKEQLTEQANKETLSIRTSHPQFLIDRWTESFGAADTANLCAWNNQPAPIYARINHLNTSGAAFLAEHPSAKFLPHHPDFVHLTGVPNDALAGGQCYVQDPSTAAACTLLDPKPGETVLDACAAPGGKTGHLAGLMKNHGLIVACDRDAGRIRTLQDNLQRLGVQIAQCRKHDWRNGGGPPGIVSQFDRILVDAPCSNTGVMRRRVDLRWRLTPEDFLRMQEEQIRILRATIPLLKLGGVLVYSTCSLEGDENAEVTHAIMREFSFMTLRDQLSSLPFRDGLDGAYAAKLIRDA